LQKFLGIGKNPSIEVVCECLFETVQDLAMRCLVALRLRRRIKHEALEAETTMAWSYAIVRLPMLMEDMDAQQLFIQSK